MSTETAAPAPQAAPAIESAEQANAALADGAKRSAIAKAPGDFSTLALRNEQTAAREFLQRQNVSTDGVTQAPAPKPLDTTSNPLAGAYAPLAESQITNIEAEGRVRGLDPLTSMNLAQSMHAAGMSESLAKSIMRKAAEHTKTGGNKPATPEHVAKLKADAIRQLGGQAKAAEKARQAIAYLRSLPPSAKPLVDAFTRSTISLDAEVIVALSGHAAARNIKS